MQELTKLVLALECPYCGMGPGEWCRSPKSDLKSRYLHADRGRSVYRAWQRGYREGVKDGAVQAQRDAAHELRRTGWTDVARWLEGNASATERLDPHAHG